MNKFNIISYKHAEGYSANIEWRGSDLSIGESTQQHHILFVLDSSFSMNEQLSRIDLLPPNAPQRKHAWLDYDDDGELEGNVFNATMLPSPKRLKVTHNKTPQIQQAMMPPMSLRQVSCSTTVSMTNNAYVDSDKYSQNSKYNMLCKCMRKALTLVKTLSDNGSDITVTIINYSSTATVRVENSPVTEDIMSKIDMWLKPTMCTNFGDALLKAREIAGKYTDRKTSIVLVSDGYNTTGYSDDKIKAEFFNSVDLSIGIGNASDYNEELMDAIGKNFRGTPDEHIFRDSFASFVFGSTTCVARNIKVTISTPFITPVSGDKTGFEVDDFHSHRHLPFFVKGDTEVVIIYTLVEDEQERIEKFVLSSDVAKNNDTSAMEIYLYCDIARKVSDGLNNKVEIKKFVKIMDTFLDEHKQVDGGSGIRGLLIALKNNLKRAITEVDVPTFEGLMRNTSSQTKQSQFDSVAREVSNDIVISLTQATVE
jgi:hypothetical protein